MTTTENAAPDLEQVKQRQQQMWASGDFHAVATLIQPVAETICDSADLQAGWRVIDVACGSGNAAIAAARRGCDGRRRRLRAGAARARPPPRRGRGRDVDLRRGRRRGDPGAGRQLRRRALRLRRDVRAGPPPRGRRATRVCRRGGTIALATWTPDGFIGEMLRTCRRARAARPGRRLAAPLGHGGVPARRPGRRDRRAHEQGADVHVPVRLGGDVRGLLPHVLRADGQGVRGRRAGAATRRCSRTSSSSSSATRTRGPAPSRSRRPGSRRSRSAARTAGEGQLGLTRPSSEARRAASQRD